MLNRKGLITICAMELVEISMKGSSQCGPKSPELSTRMRFTNVV
jgi:hypothetical protein